jgi:hypothetical protein
MQLTRLSRNIRHCTQTFRTRTFECSCHLHLHLHLSLTFRPWCGPLAWDPGFRLHQLMFRSITLIMRTCQLLILLWHFLSLRYLRNN